MGTIGALLSAAALGAGVLTAAVVPPAEATSLARGAAVTANSDQCRPGSSAAFADTTWRLISSAENSTLDWKAQYGYIEYNVEGVASENRGYTAGIVGFTSRTHDMLLLVRDYVRRAPTNNPLARFLPALQRVDGTSSRAGLGSPFVTAWRQAARDPRFVAAQDAMAEQMYIAPAQRLAQADGLGRLGQFAYIDAMIMHGPGDDRLSFHGIRAAALGRARPPARGGDERRYIGAFLDARVTAMRAEEAHADTSRVDHAQRRFLSEGNLDLHLPLRWSVYGDRYELLRLPGC